MREMEWPAGPDESWAPSGVRLGLVVALAVWTFTPIGVLAVVSLSGGWHFPALSGGDFGVGAWTMLLEAADRLVPALGVSMTLGVVTGALASTLGFVLGRALSGLPRGWRVLGAACAFLPVAVPPISLGVGLHFTFLSGGLGGSLAGVALAHLVPALGYTTLFFLGVFTVFEDEVEREARRLGAGLWETLFRVTVPLLLRPLAEAFVLGFLVSWAQVPLTLLIGQGRVRTLTVEVLSWVQAGQDPLAAAGSLVLILPPLLVMGVAAWGFQRARVAAP